MEAPPRIESPQLSDYLEVMTKAVFQSGISWRVVEAKWPGFREAFDGFDPERVAAKTPDAVDRFAADPRIIRNRRKIEATIENAATLQQLAEQHGGFDRYLRALGDFPSQVADLTRNFRFLGESGAYYLLYVVGETVPPHEEWMASRKPAKRASTATAPN